LAEPDPIAALAAQLEELRGQLARYTGETGHLRARLEEGSGQVLMLRLEIKKLGEKIDAEAVRQKAEEPPAPFWLGLSRDEHAARLAELRAWVEQVGLVQYRDYFDKLPLCWPSHPGAVIELSTVMAEWVRIYGAPDNRPLPDALVWNDKWLPGALGRLGAVIKCDMGGCRLAKPPAWERSPPRYS
jgi:regulator of replication initiation timing